jgi:hypothetical protein
MSARGYCHGCRRYVVIDSPPGSHIRSGHDAACDGSCRLGRCPVPIECGPVTPDQEDDAQDLLDDFNRCKVHAANVDEDDDYQSVDGCEGCNIAGALADPEGCV